MSKCAACGKGGDNLKVCTSCEQVCYCNAKCRKAHRSKHKKECRQLAAERHNKETAVSSSIDVNDIIENFSKIEISDEELFADPPPKEDCEICFLPMPYCHQAGGVGTTYQQCCGKTICSGCMVAEAKEMRKGNLKRLCAFCRVQLPSSDIEKIERTKKRMELDDANAFFQLAGWYSQGKSGLPRDDRKAFELYSRAAELGSIQAHCLLASLYMEKDDEKFEHHLMLAAVRGSEIARYALGGIEVSKGNTDRAMKHYMIAAKSGWDDSMESVGQGFKDGHVTKEDYATTLRAYQDSCDEMKSEQRSVTHALRNEK